MVRRVLVTGCSSDSGLLTAVEAARRGPHVVATLRNLAVRAALDAAARHAGVTLDVRRLDLDDASSFVPFEQALETVTDVDALGR